MKTPDWIGLLEASYDLSEPDTNVWLKRVLNRAVDLFEHDFSVGVMTASYTPTTFNTISLLNTGSAELLELARAMNGRAPPEFLNLVYKGGATLRSFSQDLFPRFPAMRAATVQASRGKIQDVIGVAGHTGTGYVVTLSSLC